MRSTSSRWLAVVVVAVIVFQANSNAKSRGIVWNCCKPDNGVIPDASTAIAVAKAVLFPIYHEQGLQNEEPFSALLKDGVWTVTGAPPKVKPPKTEKEDSGSQRVTIDSAEGPLQVLLSKQDGRVLRCCLAQGKLPE